MARRRQWSPLVMSLARLNVADQNTRRDKLKAGMKADLLEDLFNDIEESMLSSAALLLSQLKADHMQAAPFDKYRDGKAAWDAIVSMSTPDAQRPGEANEHDGVFVALQLKPLAAEATAQEFSLRVTDFTTNHLPYLDRPFSSKLKEASWVLQQVPSVHGSECRNSYDNLSDALKANPLHVAQMCADIISRAQPADTRLRDKLSEFIGNVDVVPPEATHGARRPQGLNGRGANQSRGGGRGTGRGRGRGDEHVRREQAVGCSVASPRGPMCSLNHHSPCWRDHRWAGPLSRRVARNADAVADINKDRAANAARLGETCVALLPTVFEDVAMLDLEDDDDPEQWPLDPEDISCEDPPPLSSAPPALTFRVPLSK